MLCADSEDGTLNAFNSTGSMFIGALACALDRNAMLAGHAASGVCFQNGQSVDSLLPSDLDGSTSPPAGSPNYFVHFVSGALHLYQFHADFATPSNSTFTGPTSIPVNAFSEACGGGACVPRAGTSQPLDSLGDRLMYRLAYRNFGDHEALVVNHSIAASTSIGARWYELRQTPPGSGGFGVYQQGTFAPDGSYRWMGSIAMDKAGNIALGYSVSSAGMHPSIAYTVHVPGTDALGTMEAETTILTGSGSQTSLNRWGDYSSMSVDPVDDCTFWYTNEYLPANGSFNWQTRIASFALPSCTGVADFGLSAAPGSQSVLQGGSTSYTVSVSPLNSFAGTVSLAASGGPSGTNFGFNPGQVTGSGSSSLSVTVPSTATPGTYTVTVTGTSGSLTHSTTVTLVVRSLTADFSISASPSSQTVIRGSSTTYTVTVGALNGFSGTVNFSVSGLPSRTSASFSPTSVTGSGSSILAVNTSSKTRRGTYTLTIKGTGGGLAHSTTVTLVMQ